MKKLTNEDINNFIRENKESEKNFEKITIGDYVIHPTFTNLKWTVESIFIYENRFRARLVSNINDIKPVYSSSFLDDLILWAEKF